MITYNDVPLVISAISYFSMGFYLGRRNALGFMMASLILLLSSLVSIMLNGLYMHSGAMLYISVYGVWEVVTSIAFLWGLGYAMSYLLLVKKDNFGKWGRS